jgi:MSHA pilin protein MshD
MFRVQGSRFKVPGLWPRVPNIEHGTLNLERRKSRGLSLIELIMFIVIVGAAVAGIIGMISLTTQSSADPMVRKQALSIAEAMLEEVRLQPFTLCDADDTGGATVAIGTIASASASGGNTTLDATGVDLSGQNAVVVFVHINNNSDETVTSVVIDPGGANVNMGAPMANINNTQSGGNDARLYVFGLANPPQGTFTIRATFNNALDSGAASHIVVYPLSGVDTASPFGTPGTAENDGQGSVTVPAASGELVLAGMAAEYKGASTVASPAVEDRDLVTGSDSLATAHQDGASPSVTFNWSGGGSGDHWAAAGVSVKPGCAEAIGPETHLGVLETRYSVPLFDHVNDYHGFDSSTAVLSGIRDIDGSLIAGLDSYRVTVSVAGQPLGGIGNDADGNPQSLLITVTVTGPGNTSVTLNGYRTRYAPNDVP